MSDMARAVHGERNRHVDYWTLFGVFEASSLKCRFRGSESLEAASLTQAMGELTNERPLRHEHLLPVARAALRRSEGDRERALELATVFYHVVREVVGRNLVYDPRYVGMGSLEMLSKFSSYATVLLGMDDMVELMEHMSPGGDPPVELLSALFL